MKSLELILLHCFGYDCDYAYSGLDAIKLVKNRIDKIHKYGCSEGYTLILTDINMPEMDGL